MYHSQLNVSPHSYLMKTLSTLFTIASICTLHAQDKEIPITYYNTTVDYVNGIVNPENAIALVKEVGEDYLWVKKIINASTRKRSREGNTAWAISHDSSTYFNLQYSHDRLERGAFMKMHVEGRFCISVIDFTEKSPLQNTDQINVLGFTNFMVKETVGWGKGWRTDAGDKKHLLFTDTNMMNIVNGKNSFINLLKRETVRILANKAGFHQKATDFTVEEIIAMISSLNSK